MKTITQQQIFSLFSKKDLINYIKNELSFKDCIAILMYDKNRYCELLQNLNIEVSLVNECDLFIVLEQKLKDAFWNELIHLIEKNIPHEDLIKILTSILRESKNIIKSIK